MSDWVEKARKSIMDHEGLRLKVYRCPAGKLTIGYGRNLEDVGISQEEASMLLDSDLKAMEPVAKKLVADFSALSSARQAVLVEMAYNLGPSGVARFKKFLAAIRKGDHKTAAVEMLDSSWAKQVGQRAKTLSDIWEKG